MTIYFYLIFILKHILIESQLKGFNPITLMCDHYQYIKKVKKPGERQVQSIHFNKYILKKRKAINHLKRIIM